MSIAFIAIVDPSRLELAGAGGYAERGPVDDDGWISDQVQHTRRTKRIDCSRISRVDIHLNLGSFQRIMFVLLTMNAGEPLSQVNG
jgi:hypothetical protein